MIWLRSYSRVTGNIFKLASCLTEMPHSCQLKRNYWSSPSLQQSLIFYSRKEERLELTKLPVLMTTPCRWKGKKKSYSNKDDQSDDEDDDEGRMEDDWGMQGKDSKIVTLKITSLRTDLVLKAGLNMARNKIETLFYESKIRVNGQKLLKKSSQVNIGDEIDVIRGPSPDNPDNFLLVSRIEILAAQERDAERLSVKVRRYPKLIIETYNNDS